jgi:hypothetical protein
MDLRRALGVGLLVVAVPASGAAAPFLPSGGLRFGAGTLLDPQRTLAGPMLRVDPSGALWVAGRGQAVVFASTDGGDSFRPTSPLSAPGGAPVDVTTDGRGTVHAVTAAGSDAIGAAVSSDGGATWRQSTLAVPGSLVGRPSISVVGGTVFVAAPTTAGPYVLSSADGLSFVRAGPLSTATRCGRLVYDPVRRALYLPCAQGGRVELVAGDLGPAGVTYRSVLAPPSPGGGGVASPVPHVAVDRAGNVYAVWVDSTGLGVYLAASGDGGATWGAAVQVNDDPALANALPAAVGGAPGQVALAWLGNATARDPNVLPAPTSDARGATAYRWYVYAALVSGATSGSPAVFQQRVTAKPVHFGRICAQCADGDPLIGDSLGLGLDPATGAMTVVYDDTTAPLHGPQPYAARQVAGPTAFGQSVDRPVPETAISDPGGDAPRAGRPDLDLTGVQLSQSGPSSLRVRMTLAGPLVPTPPPGAAGVLWLTRFQVLSTGQAGEDAYRTFWVAASAAGGAPAFSAGTASCDAACKVFRYVPSGRAPPGTVEGSTITIDVALDGGFGASAPLNGDLLYGVSAFALVRPSSPGLDDVADATAAFDYRLEDRIGRTTGKGKHVTARGTIRVPRSGRASFRVDVFENKTGRVVYNDPRGRVAFTSTTIAKVRLAGRVATISGTGREGGRTVAFVVTVADRASGGRRDTFAIRLGSYRRSGRLASGDASIRPGTS